MAWIKNQYYGNTETAVVPSNMPPFTPQIATKDDSFTTASWVSWSTSTPNQFQSNLLSACIACTGTHSNTVTMTSDMSFANTLNVSAISTMSIRIGGRPGGADSSHPFDIYIHALYRGQIVASTSRKRFTSTLQNYSTYNTSIDLTGVSKIDAIRIECIITGTATAGGKGWRIGESSGEYIKFE